VSIIGIHSPSFCDGDLVAEQVASRRDFRLIAEDLFEVASRDSGITAARLEKALKSLPPFWNQLTHQQERALACLQLTLARLVEPGRVLVHGPAVYLFPRDLKPVLRVSVVAGREYRIRNAVRQLQVSRTKAGGLIQRMDQLESAWARTYLDSRPFDGKLFDLSVSLGAVTIQEAVSEICRRSESLERQESDTFRQAIADFQLAAEVNVHLVEKGHYVQVTASEGRLSIVLNQYVTRLQKYKQKLEAIARQVPGVKSVKITPGTRFIPPALTRSIELEAPSKVLLVDDEQDFVQSLSERLEVRDIPSAVALGGEEALSYLENEEAEVMVLDLKMPGIDGIEVLRRVKRDYPDVEVIILTGHGSEREERLAKELGAFAYLHKPIDIDELTTIMKEAYRKLEKKKAEKRPDDV